MSSRREACPHCSVAIRVVSWAYEPREAEDAPEGRPEVVEGLFGARPAGSRSRYREHVPEDLYRGRRAGGHEAATVRKMPKVQFAYRVDATRTIVNALLLAELEREVAAARTPRVKIDDAAAYKAELFAQASVELLAGVAAHAAVLRAERQLKRVHRELEHEELEILDPGRDSD